MNQMMKFGLGAALALFAAGAAAQTDVGAEITAEEVPDQKRVTLEIQPLPALMSAIPGVGAFGASAEVYVGDKWAVFVEGMYADVNLKTAWIDRAREETDEPLVKEANGFSTGAGVRYYEDPIGDSFYGGAVVSYGELRADWTYDENALYTSELYTVTPAVLAGYRWVWRNGVLVRLGAGVGMPAKTGETITPTNTTAATDEGLDRIEDLQDQTVIARLDLGLGYSF